MDDVEKQAFRSLIDYFENEPSDKAIQKYDAQLTEDESFEKAGLTTRGLLSLVYGYNVVDKPEEFGVEKLQAQIMRTYFKETSINISYSIAEQELEEVLSEYSSI